MNPALTIEPRCQRHAAKGGPVTTAALVAAIIVILVATPRAQQPVPAFAAASGASAGGAILEAPTDVDLLVGRSTVLNIGAAIARVSLTVPDIAAASAR